MMRAMYESLHLAVAQPACFAVDVERNALARAALIRRSGARLVVFPAMSLTGYHLDASPVLADGTAVAPLVDACAAADAVALVGAPVVSGDPYIAMLRFHASGGSVVYLKRWLGAPEQARFT